MPEPTDPSSTRQRSMVRVWDLPIRVFHWLLAALVVGAFVTAKIGGNAMILHERFGVAILALLVFRVVWGLVGSRHARFLSFVRGPRAVASALREGWQGLGHSPLAGWSVLALLGALGFQAVSGLFANDDIAFEGPLAVRVSSRVSGWLTDLHEANESVLIGLVSLHLAAIAWYALIRRRNLVRPMISGDAPAPPGAQGSRDDLLLRVGALLLAAACGAAAWFMLLR
jgi:cytochrome b